MKNDQAIIINPFVFLTHFSLTFHWRIFLRISLFLLVAILISLICFLFFQINKLAQETDSLRTLEQKLISLSQENQDLRIKSSQINRQIFAQDLIQEFNFEKVERIHFIRTSEKQVVTK